MASCRTYTPLRVMGCKMCSRDISVTAFLIILSTLRILRRLPENGCAMYAILILFLSHQKFLLSFCISHSRIFRLRLILRCIGLLGRMLLCILDMTCQPARIGPVSPASPVPLALSTPPRNDILDTTPGVIDTTIVPVASIRPALGRLSWRIVRDSQSTWPNPIYHSRTRTADCQP